jgi:hypothetical protein
MEDLKEKTVDLVDHAEDFADTFYKLALVNVTQKATNAGAGIIAIIAICTFGFFVLLFGGLALSWWLGNLLESRVAGFLLGSGFFLVVMIIIVLLRKQIIFPYIRDLIIRKIHD